MKVRNGFVSNSSSSSFVVAFPKKFDHDKAVKEFFENNGFEMKDLDAFTKIAKDVVSRKGYFGSEGDVYDDLNKIDSFYADDSIMQLYIQTYSHQIASFNTGPGDEIAILSDDEVDQLMKFFGVKV